MAILTKPVNLAFIVSHDKKDKFLDSKRDSAMLLKKFKKLKAFELSQGKSLTSPRIKFLSNKIKELESEIEDGN